MEAMRVEESTMEFMVANTGSKAVDLLRNIPAERIPKVILLDYNLPEISGAEVLSRIRDLAQYEGVTKIVWSTSNSPIYQKKCMEVGANAYIVKPTGIAGIRDIARQMVDLCRK